jgi:hypothetical protein
MTMIICDHLFNADYSKSKRLSVGRGAQDTWPANVVFGGTTSQGALHFEIASGIL